MNNNFARFETMTAEKAVLSNVLPAMMAMVMALVYNIADLFFIGQTGDPLQVAAVSLATPIFLMFMSSGNIFGIGGASISSRSLGSGNSGLVPRISSFCFWCCVVVGLLLSAGLYFNMNSVVLALGASADIEMMVSNYLKILCISGVFILISNCFANLIRAEGKPEKAMTGMLLGNLVNLVLDPIFILYFNMGVEGAAIATAIGNFIGGCYYIFYLLKAQTLLSIKISDFSFDASICKNVLIIGIPASLASILMGISQMLINAQMASYGDMPLAGIGVATKVSMMTSMICIGLGMGVQPLLGYFIGSQNEQRYLETLKFSLKFAFGMSVTLTALCWLFLPQIVGAFVTDQAAYDYAYQFSQVYLYTSVLIGILFVFVNALQAAGAASFSLLVNISRQGLVYIPMLFIFGHIWGLDGLIYAQPVADICAVSFAAFCYSRVHKTLFSKEVEIL